MNNKLKTFQHGYVYAAGNAEKTLQFMKEDNISSYEDVILSVLEEKMSAHLSRQMLDKNKDKTFEDGQIAFYEELIAKLKTKITRDSKKSIDFAIDLVSSIKVKNTSMDDVLYRCSSCEIYVPNSHEREVISLNKKAS